MRKIHLLCAALLSAATLLSGCGQTPETPVTPETPSGDYISNASRSATASM